MKRVLAQPLRDRGVAATPESMDGDVTSGRMARELATGIGVFDCVTSFVDFYGFRDKADSTVGQLEQVAEGKAGMHGPLIAEDIGLATPRTECRRFGNRMEHLERLGP